MLKGPLQKGPFYYNREKLTQANLCGRLQLCRTCELLTQLKIFDNIKTVRNTHDLGGSPCPTLSSRPAATITTWVTPMCTGWDTPSSGMPTVRSRTGAPAAYLSRNCKRSSFRALFFNPKVEHLFG